MICNLKRFVTIVLLILVCILPSQAREKRAVIGISASKPSSATETYVQAVRRAGGVPLIIPITADDIELQALLKVVDGVIMTGGEDVEPWRYGHEPIPELGGVYPERDEFDIKLLRMAAERRLPIMGICRGLQVMNVAFGGTLYQDIPTQISDKSINHSTGSGKIRAHKIAVKQGTRLYKIIGDSAVVNSTHHQSVQQLAPGFRITAVAEDGVVEGIEMANGRPIFGVQFHPEVFVSSGEDEFLGLFEYFIKAAK